MNWLLIIVLGILVVCMFEGYRNGMVRMVFSMVILVVVLTAGSFITPYMKVILCEYTDMEEQLRQSCEEYIRQKTEEQIAATTAGMTGPAAEIGLLFPEELMDELAVYGGNAINDIVDHTGLYQELSAGVADFVVGGVAYFLSVSLVFLICYLLMRILNLLTMLPGIKAANKFFGLILGLGKGLLIVWLMLYLISLFCASSRGGQLFTYISDSTFLSWLYHHNFIMWFLCKVLLG